MHATSGNLDLGLVNADLVRRDAEAFFHQAESSPCLAGLEGAEGIWLTDLDGRRYVDLHGNSAHHLGYRHPRLIEALREQLQHLTFSPRRFTNDSAVPLAESLVRRWPGPRAKVLFATGGSDAIEIALRLALVATRRQEIVSLEGSYHGHGFGALGLSSVRVDPRLTSTQPLRHHITPYWAVDDGGAERMVEDAERAFAQSREGIAAFIAEPIRSNFHVPPDWLWPAIRALCTKHGARLVFDEIPSGLGKTGRFFAFEHFGAIPDAVVLGKALGGGMLPIAAVVADAALDVAPELNLGHYTHEKNPLTTRVALETIAVIDEEGLADRAARRGAYVRDAVDTLAARCGLVGRSRGKGLLIAIELEGKGEQSRKLLADQAIRCCLAHGVSTVTKSGGALSFSPPMVITEAEIDVTVERLERALRAL
jgi:4-aminobutyrate aminotransferase